MEQSGNGLASRMPGMGRNAAGVMEDSPALIPLVGNNSRFQIDYSNANAYIYTFHEAVDYQPFRLPSYSYSYYLFTIILTDYSNN